MSDKRFVQFIEIDLPPCGQIYGVYPCAASLGVTGDFKCYNSPATCQDTDAFTDTTPITVRLSIATEDLTTDIPSLPFLKSVTTRPQESYPSRSMGTRANIVVVLTNGRHNDVGFDPYIDERGFNTYLSGTFLGKLCARWPNMQGYPLRHIVGEFGQDLADMETSHYYIETRTGPTTNSLTIEARDALKFLDDKKAQAPVANNGRLLSAINDTDTAITLTPTGIGDTEYPTSGKATVGSEIVTYTRSGDAITLTARGLQGSTAEDHEADEVFQIILTYTAQDPADIIDDLIFNYTQLPAIYQNLSTWQDETTEFYGRLLSADICRPTAVSVLLTELIEQCGLHFFSDIINQKLIMNVLRKKNATLTLTDDIVKPDQLSFKIDEKSRISQIWILYGQRNPIINLNEDGNFRGISATVDDDPIKLIEDLPPAIRKIRSRWISTDNVVAAEDLGDNLLNIYGNTPGETDFVLPTKYPVRHGDHVAIQSRIFEDAQGQTETKTGIVTRVERRANAYVGTIKNLAFRNVSLETKAIIIDYDSLNINLRDLHDSIYTLAASGDVINVTISANVKIGSVEFSYIPGFDVGSWPAGVTINITNNGKFYGHGGRGAFVAYFTGNPSNPPSNSAYAADGGTALYTRYPINLTNNGFIYGGGGGGGAGVYANGLPVGQYSVQTWGGYGAGYDFRTSPSPVYEAVYPGVFATGIETPGDPLQYGGDGGGPGQDGETIVGTPNGLGVAGVAGAAVDGHSYVNYVASGTIAGPQVN